jgi:hypothetical protein
MCAEPQWICWLGVNTPLKRSSPNSSDGFRKSVVTEDVFHDVIDTLTSEGLLSNERYAQSMARQLIGRGSGPKKLTYELKQKGCDPQRALDSAFPDGCRLVCAGGRVVRSQIWAQDLAR